LSTKKTKFLVFADLDGTLLNENYQSSEVEEIIQSLISLNASVVFASSKTADEVVFYREKLNVKDPFIVENGSAIFIPSDYFRVNYAFSRHEDGYNIIELGTSYEVIRKKFLSVKRQIASEIIGFGDMSVEDVAKDTGLPLYLAGLAKNRQYSEPFKILSGDERMVFQAIKNQGLCYTMGGRYFHVLGCSDKGKAATKLKDVFMREYCDVCSIGVGNGENDLPMLQSVDLPFFVHNTNEIHAVWSNIKSTVERKFSGGSA
jgi:mannosyl-3-phosphoglycerate phosphatase